MECISLCGVPCLCTLPCAFIEPFLHQQDFFYKSYGETYTQWCGITPKQNGCMNQCIMHKNSSNIKYAMAARLHTGMCLLANYQAV